MNSKLETGNSKLETRQRTGGQPSVANFEFSRHPVGKGQISSSEILGGPNKYDWLTV